MDWGFLRKGILLFLLFTMAGAARADGTALALFNPTAADVSVKACATDLEYLAVEGAKVVAHRRERDALAREIVESVKRRHPELAEATKRDLKIAVLEELASYQRRLEQKLPSRAKWAFGISGALQGLLMCAKTVVVFTCSPVVTAVTNGIIDFLMYGYVNRMVGSSSQLVWARIDAFWQQFGARRHSPFPTSTVNAIADDLARITQVWPMRINPFLEGARGASNGALNTMETGLGLAMIVAEVVGDREGAAQLVAEYVRVYLMQYPAFEPYERILTTALREKLRRVGNRHFQNRVREILKERGLLRPPSVAPGAGGYTLDPILADRVIQAWMPDLREPGAREMGPPVQSNLALLRQDVHFAAAVAGDSPEARERAARMVALALKAYLQYLEIYLEYEPFVSGQIALVLEGIASPGFRDRVRELALSPSVSAIPREHEVRVSPTEVDYVLRLWFPAAGSSPAAAGT